MKQPSAWLTLSVAFVIPGIVQTTACGSIHTTAAGKSNSPTSLDSAASSATATVSTANHGGPVSSAKPSPATSVLKRDADESAACFEIRKKNAEVFSEAMNGVATAPGHCSPEMPRLGCFTTANVTWGYRITSAESGIPIASRVADEPVDAPESIECETMTGIQLVRRDAAGAVDVSDANIAIHQSFFDRDEIALRPLADYDHDGEAEFLRVRSSWIHEGGSDELQAVMSFKKGALAEYGPAQDLKIEKVEDIDKDGLPDLITRGPYVSVSTQDAFGNDVAMGPAIFVWHALGDGTFSMTDNEAQRYTRARCPAKPKIALKKGSIDTLGGPAEDVVCARLWGVSEAQIVSAWNAACAVVPTADRWIEGCHEYPKKLAAVAVPFRL